MGSLRGEREQAERAALIAPAGRSTSGPTLRIVTGAPGTGKSAILGRVRGVRWVAEPAREILAEQRAAGGDGTPEQDPTTFVELLLRRSIDKHDEATRWHGVVLFDRGIPDCVTYARLLGTDPRPSVQASRTYRYHSEVLVTRPWAEIYVTDDERRMPFDATLEFQRSLEHAYEDAGYALIDVPRGPIDDRVAFVEDVISGVTGP